MSTMLNGTNKKTPYMECLAVRHGCMPCVHCLHSTYHIRAPATCTCTCNRQVSIFLGQFHFCYYGLGLASYMPLFIAKRLVHCIGRGPTSVNDSKQHGLLGYALYMYNILYLVLQVSALLERAGKNRAVAATLCNEHSSRSHSVFRLKLTGNNDKTGQSSQGKCSVLRE